MKKSSAEALRSKIARRDATVCVVGLGYVGLPLALRFAEIGFPVLGLDIDRGKVDRLEAEACAVEGRSAKVRASTDSSLLKEADAAVVCVPTPLSKTRDPDLSLVLDATRAIAKHLHPGELVVLESTTYPGTTREVLLPALEETGLKVGEDFFLAYSPERIDPGNPVFRLDNTPKVVAGITAGCLELARALYSGVVSQVVVASSTDAAEMTKLLENVFRSVNIALVNEFAIMCYRLGLNVWEVIDAAATKPFGFLPFYPGPGLGGHCIPVDPHYLSWRLRLLEYKARFIELADEINREMPRFVVEKVVEGLNGKSKSVRGSRILILGVSYKTDSDDIRESPALDIMKLLDEKGGAISYHDPHVPHLSFNGKSLRSQSLRPDFLSSFDVVVIVTAHASFDPRAIVEHSSLVIDSRNLTRGIQSDKIIRL